MSYVDEAAYKCDQLRRFCPRSVNDLQHLDESSLRTLPKLHRISLICLLGNFRSPRCTLDCFLCHAGSQSSGTHTDKRNFTFS